MIMLTIFFISVTIGIVIAIIHELLVYRQENKMKNICLKNKIEIDETLKALAQKKSEKDLQSEDIRIQDYLISFNKGYIDTIKSLPWLNITKSHFNKTNIFDDYFVSDFQNEDAKELANI